MRTPLLALLLPWLAACHHDSASPMPPTDTRPSSAMTTVLRAAHTAIRGERNVVVRDADDWHEFWREHNSAQLATADAPAIDFERQMVVGVVLGTCSTGGHSVEVRRVETHDGRLRVVAHHQRPAEGSIQPMVLTKPIHLVVVERTDAEVEFVWE